MEECEGVHLTNQIRCFGALCQMAGVHPFFSCYQRPSAYNQALVACWATQEGGFTCSHGDGQLRKGTLKAGGRVVCKTLEQGRVGEATRHPYCRDAVTEDNRGAYLARGLKTTNKGFGTLECLLDGLLYRIEASLLLPEPLPQQGETSHG